MAESKYVDLYLISGFLGSGKTTFLQNVLNSLDTKDVGVIVNEFGSVSIDGKMLEDEEIPLVEINRGSIFCACLKGGFVKTLAAFLKQPVNKVYVEASGMADPSSIEKLLTELEPYLERKYKTDRRYRYRGCVCLVDARRFLALSSSLVAIPSQVKKSNLVVVNKTDRVNEGRLSQVHEKINEINPNARIYDTTYAKVPEDILEEILQGELEVSDDKSLNTSESRPYGGILTLPEACDLEKVRALLEAYSKKVYRVKGFFKDKDSCYLVSCVDNDIDISEWKDEKKENKLVLITEYSKGLEEWLEEEWNKIFSEPIDLVEE